MGLLEGKKGLIVGVANDHSIAWGIAQALHREGADLAFTYLGEQLERRVRPLAESLGSQLIVPCDLGSDEQIAEALQQVGSAFGQIDMLVHSAAFAKTDELRGSYLNTSREGFRLALDISAYSLTALIKAADPYLSPTAAILTMTYHGSQQVVPNYNVQGVAKAALEASVRYLAADLGPRGIRVNAISAGPIRTLAASAVSGIRDMIKAQQETAPLRRKVTIEDVGNTAIWLCSDLASGVTGEIVYVDAGANIMAMVPGGA
ncbi:MAG: enoyl-ACP reductase [Chloroflexota bacterium]|nr:enoyl-ACP reductase [Chloroflexota bacterium]